MGARRFRFVGGVLAMVGLLATTVTDAAAQDSDPPLDSEYFQLRPNSLGDELGNRVDALDTEFTGDHVVGVGDVLADANRQGTVGAPGTPCNDAAAGTGVAVTESLCFAGGGDENPHNDNDTDLWYPQGVSTVADAQDDKEWGDGNQPVLVSWYDHADDGTEKGVRISFVDKKTGKYRHVLLAYPKWDGNDNATYEAVKTEQTADGTSLHAGGIVWYGNFLYVADTNRGFRVFDMRHIYDLAEAPNGSTGNADLVGRHDGVYHGHGYRYVMPQVASWTATAPPTDSDTVCTADAQRMRFSYAGLDRSGADHLVAGEYCNGKTGRVAAWPIADATENGEQITDENHRWQADTAHRLPVTNVQGAARFHDRWYLSASAGSDDNGTLTRTEKAGGSTDLTTDDQQPAAIGPEDLAHWEDGQGGTTLGDMWTVSEHPGKRMIYASTP